MNQLLLTYQTTEILNRIFTQDKEASKDKKPEAASKD